jgi:hypothetical protein
MSTVKEIEAAINALPQKQRQKLVERLPLILPELDGDGEWERIITDNRPRRELSELGDKIAAQLIADPESFLEIREDDFNQKL